MLRRPPSLWLPAVVVCPHDLVQEAVASEDLVERELAVVRLAVVEVEIERSMHRKQPASVLEAGDDEVQVLAPVVVEAQVGQQARPVAASPEPDALSRLVVLGGHRALALDVAGVERRVDVDEVKARVRQLGQDVGVLGMDQQVLVELDHAGGADLVGMHEAHREDVSGGRGHSSRTISGTNRTGSSVVASSRAPSRLISVRCCPSTPTGATSRPLRPS